MMYRNNKYDVIVIGAGPAGAMAGYYLADAGLKTLLLEKKILPRYKTCGGGLTYKALSLLPFELNGIIDKQFHSCEIYDHINNLRFEIKRDVPIISMMMRSNFDLYLVERAAEKGCNVKDGINISGISVHTDNLELSTGGDKYFGNFIVAADGINGLTVKLFSNLNNFRRVPALEYEVYTNKEDHLKLSQNTRFDFGFTEDGYAWVFPKSNHLSVGVGVFNNNINNNNLNNIIKNYMSMLGISNSERIEKHGYIIPFANKFNLVNRRIFFTGDTAGLADPTTAEGISNAILSGKLAAEAIINSHMNMRTAHELYSHSVRKEIISELSYAKLLSKIIYYYPKLRSLLFRLNGYKLSSAMTDIITNQKTYKKYLLNPVNYLKLFRIIN